MNSSIDLKRLNHLVLLSEELHFSRAAARAHLSQTAFSRSIQSLENDLQLRLFDRGTRSVQLTAVGRQLLESARELLRHAHNLTTEAQCLAQAEGGELNFGAGLLAVHSYMQELLPMLRNDHPGLQLHIEVDHWQNLLRHLEQERIEFFIGDASQLHSEPHLSITVLPQQPASIYCRAGHPLLRQPHILPQQLAEYPWCAALFDDALGLHLRHLLGIPARQPLPALMSCNNLHLLRETTQHSDSLLFTWSTWLQDALSQGTLVDLAPRLTPALAAQHLVLDCSLVHLAGRSLSPAAQKALRLIQAVAERYRAEPAPRLSVLSAASISAPS
ncbi:LysR family transcriptional regulator [Pseudomonas sp. GOM6]|uniref:LysR family transcriptional regulator n=1 Tax=Pseudomonas sp. GOM6 TaxID=3036944 RepID=UPI00240922A6|nr:LysR family transcriptional regulator [Pseudomonas sp. GOM6]MDG1580092.1 LysR family transcriptional regulator [Pseudomonas sp. GOM6]